MPPLKAQQSRCGVFTTYIWFISVNTHIIISFTKQHITYTIQRLTAGCLLLLHCSYIISYISHKYLTCKASCHQVVMWLCKLILPPTQVSARIRVCLLSQQTGPQFNPRTMGRQHRVVTADTNSISHKDKTVCRHFNKDLKRWGAFDYTEQYDTLLLQSSLVLTCFPVAGKWYHCTVLTLSSSSKLCCACSLTELLAWLKAVVWIFMTI